MKSETVETADVTIDLDGNVFVDGSTTSSLPFNIFKMLADYNAVKFPALTSQNYTKFRCEYRYNNNLDVVSRLWNGFVLLEKDRGENSYTYIRMDNCVNNLEIDGFSANGIPSHFNRRASGVVTNNWKIGKDMKVYDVFDEGKSSIDVKYNSKNGGLEVNYSGNGDIKISYDEKGNVIMIKIGDAEIVRKVNY